MNLNNLRAFVKVIQTNNFNAAAKKLNISQPAVTQRIHALEEAFETKLLVREPEGVKLTSSGQLVYERSLTMLKLWDELYSELMGKQLFGKLTIGASTIPSEYLLPQLIKKFRTLYPEINLELRISGSGEVLKWLNERVIDVAVTGQPVDTTKLYSLSFQHDEIQVIVPFHSEYAEKIKHFKDLFNFEWILREPESHTRKTFENEIIKKGYSIQQLKIVGQMGSTEAIIASVEAGLGISVISSLAAKRAKHYGRVKIVPIAELQVARSFHITCLDENTSNPIISSFINFLAEQPIKKEGQL